MIHDTECYYIQLNAYLQRYWVQIENNERISGLGLKLHCDLCH